MSYISDHYQQLHHGLQNITSVFEARYNQVKRELGILSPAIEVEADRRYEICKDCPFNSVRAQTSPDYIALYGKSYSSTIDSFHCSICLCPLENKVLSMTETCGLSMYNSLYPDKPRQTPKWFPFSLHP